MIPKIAQVVVPLPIPGPFDYLMDEDMAKRVLPGQRVLVPFGPRKIVGFVVGTKAKSAFHRLKPIFDLLDSHPVLNQNFLRLTQEFSDYYCCSWGEAIEATLPKALRQAKPIESSALGMSTLTDHSVSDVVLLQDQDGQRQWDYLIERIEKTLSSSQRVIFLVPESSLVDSVCLRFKEKNLDSILVLDKRITPKKELASWIEIKQGQGKIVVGTRSAIFSPVDNLGLVIVFDENNSAYKQDQSPFYHPRDVALMRARIEKTDVIFVSAAPSLELWSQVQSKKIKAVTFDAEKKTTIQVIDMTNYNPRKTFLVSFPLKDQIQKTLDEKGKTILFLNRKGFSTSIRCSKCGYVLKCEKCDVGLIYLFEQKRLVCRFCNFSTKPLDVCPGCKGAYLRYQGMGIEKLESELCRIFPQAKVHHYDKDKRVLPTDFDILITTQAILREQGQVSADLVGVLQADNELNRLDFRASERAFQLFAQLKQFANKKIILQTHLVDNDCIQAFSKSDTKGFYRKEWKTRKELGFPPAKHLIEIMVRAPQQEAALEQAHVLYQDIQGQIKDKTTEVFEPQVFITPRLRGKYRLTILMKGKSPLAMVSLIRSVLKASRKKSGTQISVNVDP